MIPATPIVSAPRLSEGLVLDGILAHMHGYGPRIYALLPQAPQTGMTAREVAAKAECGTSCAREHLKALRSMSLVEASATKPSLYRRLTDVEA